jgi:hypothetical protein
VQKAAGSFRAFSRRSHESGTRFRLYAQAPFLDRFHEPELVTLSPVAGSLRAGPSDDDMAVAVPINKAEPYGFNATPYGRPWLYLPPWDGAREPLAQPGGEGHFDHLRPGTLDFEQAHVYGCIRFFLDIWEGYLGRKVRWHFADIYDHLEVLILRGYDNAQAGFGFLEVGEDRPVAGPIQPFALNFDVVAHEVGHLLLYGEMGVPDPEMDNAEFLGFHESAADLASMIAAAHFTKVIDDLLEATRGNLYVLNRLSRFAELSVSEQIRVASNRSRMSDFADGWTDEHDLSLPLTGCAFDIFVDIFHELLVKRRLISRGLEELSDKVEDDRSLMDLVQEGFDDAYAHAAGAIRETLTDARDIIGTVFAATYERLDPTDLTYSTVGDALIAADRDFDGGRWRKIIRDNFRRREIGIVEIGPRRAPPDDESHFYSARTVLPEYGALLPKLSYRERFMLAQGAGARKAYTPMRA